MPPVDATTLRGALLTLSEEDGTWLNSVDAPLGRVLSGTSIHISMHGLYGWLGGTRVPHLVQARIARAVADLPPHHGFDRLEPVFAVHTALAATAFFDSVREVLTGDLQLPTPREWHQEDHSFVSYLYSDDVPAPSAVQDFANTIASIATWAANRGERVHRALHRTNPRCGSEALLDLSFARSVSIRYEKAVRAHAKDVREFALWTGLADTSGFTSTGQSTIAPPSRALEVLHRANRAALDDDPPAEPGLPPAHLLYVPANYRLAKAGPVARLSDESWWASQPRRSDDVEALLATHLTSPLAFRLPLLVIGGPGSGKSMLTKVLAAHMPAAHYAVVRVQLRGAQHAALLDQVNQVLAQQTDHQFTWNDLAWSGRQCTRILVLDGLDEMADRRGDLLSELARFQKTEAALGHPVALVVTSRTSSLDQLHIPDRMPVVQLTDLDTAQIRRWVARWNDATAQTRRPLALDTVLAHPEVARNPLQLTLLALRLTNPAAVHPRGTVSATDLFQPDTPSPGLAVASVAAMGMLNRGWRPISAEELRADLAALGETDPGSAESVIGDLEQRPATVAEFRIAMLVLDLLPSAESDDALLFALLSHAPLALRPATLTFVAQLAHDAPAATQVRLVEVLDALLSRNRGHTSRYSAYQPSHLNMIRSHALYSANLVLLRLSVQEAEDRRPVATGQAHALLDRWADRLDQASRRSVLSLVAVEDGGFVRRTPPDTVARARLDPDPQAPGVEFLQRGLSADDRHTGRVTWSSDGALLAVGHGGDLAVCWRVGEDAPPEEVGRVLGVADIAWHPSRPVAAVVQRSPHVGGHHVVVTAFDGEPGRPVCSAGIGTRLSWSPDGDVLAVGEISEMTLVDSTTGRPSGAFRFAPSGPQHLLRPRWSPDGHHIWVAGHGHISMIRTADNEVRTFQHDLHARDIFVLRGAQALVAFTSPGKHDITITAFGRLAAPTTLEGHADLVTCVRFSPDGGFVASMSTDNTVRLWRAADWQCVAVLPRENISGRGGLAFHPTEPLLAIKDGNGVDVVRLDYGVLGSVSAAPTSRRYANAKIVLVGDTGVGKSGLGLVMNGQQFVPTDSTHGRNVWTFERSIETLPSGDVQTRETLLWDLAGQPGYRMVHQLHLNEVAVALVVFDARSETDPFAGVQYWSRALAQARRLDGPAAVRLKAFLVAARTDRGGTAVSTARIEQAVQKYGFDGFVETSAKEGWGVEELIRTARDAIDWEAVPVVSSTALFQSIKDFVLEEKQQGRILSTADDLLLSFRRLHRDPSPVDELAGKFAACLGRLEGVGVIRRMQFGGYVLLRPELLDAYVSSLVQAAKDEPDGLGFVPEKDALEGTFRMPESERLTNEQQERVLLITVVEELLRREIALKEVTDKEVDLIFPSQFTRERPDAPQVPGQDVVFTFDGDLASIYSTLAVRLSHSRFFQRGPMYHNSASYLAKAGGTCGIAVREVEEGKAELVLFHDEQVTPIVRRQFEAYVVEHLEQRAGNVVLRRIRRCKPCDQPVDDVVVRKRLSAGLTNVRCQLCDEFVSLLDEEQPDVRPVVAEMNSHANTRRDLDVAATTLKGKREAEDYDVFLCHNVKDKPLVLEVVAELEARGILPWIDIHDIQPGSRWQIEMAKGIEKSRSAAVLIGPSGFGPWHDAEMQLINDWSVRDTRRRVIPVILDGVDGDVDLPGFLRVWSTVDMRMAAPDPVEHLIWGITGEQSRRL
ncbi:TIR domain-containing protein [Lentzea sp. NPDC003310]|uniref:NACHT N-terminal helical domain 7-containing protein n=1 Tax=Lentzea sp. NPDC003310 TaxID=3154447 RepID=UPI0033B03E2E